MDIKRIRLFGFLILLLAAAAGLKLYSENLNRKKAPVLTQTDKVSPYASLSPEDEKAVIAAEKMNPSQLAGQVMMIGYMGDKPSAEIISWIKNKNIGGIKIFGWNADNLYTLSRSIKAMQEASGESEYKIPLFIATDQEGGWVRHIKGNSSITAGNMSLGASRLINDSYMTGMYIGRELDAVGINMNFAPTVDVLTNHDAHVIGPRAFSDNPLKTAVLAAAFVNGMKKSGIISTAKHFPGHGRTEVDSHGRLPVINSKLEEIRYSDLLPYDFLIREELPAVMSGHLAYPEITGDNTPASLSPFLLKEVLRREMGFEGIIITDDMQMNGALYMSSITESCLSALKAGNDMIMVSRDLSDYESIRNRIIKEINIDSDFEKQIRESVKRIIRTKNRYLTDRGKNSDIKKENSVSSIPSKDAEAFFRQQAFRSVSLIYKDKPVKKPIEGERILLAGPHRLFFEEGLKRFPQADTWYFPYNPFHTAAGEDISSFSAASEGYDLIIFCVSNPAGLQFLETLERKKSRVIVISVLSPAYLEDLNWPESGVAVYGTGRDSFTAGFAAIAGDFIPEGKLPIKINGER
ncbi:MAG: beta-N-acetylhexosaminidase [Spirochaetia bacterium]|nr:beta-N-acetylhexosaminidase [Spirochaetia bacterium]